MQVLQFVDIAESKDTVKVLCAVPVKDKALRKLNVSGKNLGPEGAVIVTYFLHENTALISLNLAGNKIGSAALRCVAEALKTNVSALKMWVK
jgi:hypothetical protein